MTSRETRGTAFQGLSAHAPTTKKPEVLLWVGGTYIALRGPAERPVAHDHRPTYRTETSIHSRSNVKAVVC